MRGSQHLGQIDFLRAASDRHHLHEVTPHARVVLGGRDTWGPGALVITLLGALLLGLLADWGVALVHCSNLRVQDWRVGLEALGSLVACNCRSSCHFLFLR